MYWLLTMEEEQLYMLYVCVWVCVCVCVYISPHNKNPYPYGVYCLLEDVKKINNWVFTVSSGTSSKEK